VPELEAQELCPALALAVGRAEAVAERELAAEALAL
jgi:hypothetical protein